MNTGHVIRDLLWLLIFDPLNISVVKMNQFKEEIEPKTMNALQLVHSQTHAYSHAHTFTNKHTLACTHTHMHRFTHMHLNAHS